MRALRCVLIAILVACGGGGKQPATTTTTAASTPGEVDCQAFVEHIFVLMVAANQIPKENLDDKDKIAGLKQKNVDDCEARKPTLRPEDKADVACAMKAQTYDAMEACSKAADARDAK